MKRREPVSHIMTKEISTISLHNGNLLSAKQIMEDKHIRHLPVVSGEKLVGILSLTDILRISFGGNFNQEESVDASIFDILSIEQVMKSNPKTVRPDTLIKEVAETLAMEEFHALPVVDSENNIQGIVTTTDLMKYLLEQY